MSVFDRMDPNLAHQFNTNGSAQTQVATEQEKQAAAANIIAGLQSGAIDIDALSPEEVVKMASIVYDVEGEVALQQAPTQTHNKAASPTAQQGEQLVNSLLGEFIRTGLGQEAGEKFASIMIQGGKIHAHAQWAELNNIALDQQIKEAQYEFMKISGAEWMAAIQSGEVDMNQLTPEQSAYILQKIAAFKQAEEAAYQQYPNYGSQVAQPGAHKIASIQMTDMQKTAAHNIYTQLAAGNREFLTKMSSAELNDVENLLVAHAINLGAHPEAAADLMHKIAAEGADWANTVQGKLQQLVDAFRNTGGAAAADAAAAADMVPEAPGLMSRMGGAIGGAAGGADAWMQNLATKLPGITAESAPWLKRLATYGPAAAGTLGLGTLGLGMMGGKGDDPAGGMAATASANPPAVTFNDEAYEQEVLKTAQAYLTMNGKNHGTNPFEPSQVYEDAKKLLRSKGWDLPTE